MNANRIFRWFTILLALSLLKHAYIARYAHPAADDYCYAASAQGTSLWQWSVGEFQHWNGRYTSNLLVGRGPLWWSRDFLFAYRAMPVVLMLLTFLSAWIFVRSITQRTLGKFAEAAAALVYCGLFIHAMPDIGEGFYWYTGAITYQLANAMTLLYIASLLRYRSGRPIVNAPVHMLINVVMVCSITGMDEVHMLLLVCLHVALLLIDHARGSRLDRSLVILTSVSVVCAIIVAIAPGNAVRASNFPAAHHLLTSVGMTCCKNNSRPKEPFPGKTRKLALGVGIKNCPLRFWFRMLIATGLMSFAVICRNCRLAAFGVVVPKNF